MLFSIENASIFTLVLIVLVVAAKIVTSGLLGGMKKELDKVRQELHTIRAELGFEGERRQSATELLSFNER